MAGEFIIIICTLLLIAWAATSILLRRRRARRERERMISVLRGPQPTRVSPVRLHLVR